MRLILPYVDGRESRSHTPRMQARHVSKTPVACDFALTTSRVGTKYANNPLVAEEPEGLFVTGFRDPYVTQIPALARSRGEAEDTYYGLLAGGVHHKGPCVFYYRLEDTVKWTYLGTLVQVQPPGHFPHPKWGGDFGLNWECPSVISIRQDGQPQAVEYTNLLIVGAERGAERKWVTEYHERNPKAARRVPRYSHACLLNTQPRADGTPLSMATPGLLDWGILYACNAFRLPDGRTVVWVWLIEEDLSKELSTTKGWTGKRNVLCMLSAAESLIAQAASVYLASCSFRRRMTSHLAGQVR